MKSIILYFSDTHGGLKRLSAAAGFSFLTFRRRMVVCEKADTSSSRGNAYGKVAAIRAGHF